MRQRVDDKSEQLKAKGEFLLQWLEETNARGSKNIGLPGSIPAFAGGLPRNSQCVPYGGPSSLGKYDFLGPEIHWFDGIQSFGVSPQAIPYTAFKEQLARQQEERRRSRGLKAI